MPDAATTYFSDSASIHVYRAIEADIKDLPPLGKTYASGINPESIILKLNGKNVARTITEIEDGVHVYYMPQPTDLHTDSANSVQLWVRDSANAGAMTDQDHNDAGNPTTPDPYAWSFHVNTNN